MTRRQYFERLPEQQSKQAITNTSEFLLDCECDSLESSLKSGFCWEETEQGFYYWRDLTRRYSTRVYSTQRVYTTL